MARYKKNLRDSHSTKDTSHYLMAWRCSMMFSLELENSNSQVTYLSMVFLRKKKREIGLSISVDKRIATIFATSKSLIYDVEPPSNRTLYWNWFEQKSGFFTLFQNDMLFCSKNSFFSSSIKEFNWLTIDKLTILCKKFVGSICKKRW